jgi:hypothetical protein
MSPSLPFYQRLLTNLQTTKCPRSRKLGSINNASHTRIRGLPSPANHVVSESRSSLFYTPDSTSNHRVFNMFDSFLLKSASKGSNATENCRVKTASSGVYLRDVIIVAKGLSLLQGSAPPMSRACKIASTVWRLL